MIACLTRFMPLFTKLIADDLFRSELKKAPDEIVEEFVANYGIQVPDQNIFNFIKSDAVCALLWFHYTIKVLTQKNLLCSRDLLENYMKVVCKSKDKVVLVDHFLLFLSKFRY